MYLYLYLYLYLLYLLYTCIVWQITARNSAPSVRKNFADVKTARNFFPKKNKKKQNKSFLAKLFLGHGVLLQSDPIQSVSGLCYDLANRPAGLPPGHGHPNLYTHTPSCTLRFTTRK